MRLPAVYTARYLTGRLPHAGLVPVRASMLEPVVPLAYTLEEIADATTTLWAFRGPWAKRT